MRRTRWQRRTRLSRCSAIGGRPRPPWIRIGNVAVRGELEDGSEAFVVESEALGARMELDPLRAQIESAVRLLERTLRQVEPDIGDEAAGGPLGMRERAVVRHGEARLAIVLVHAEDVGA